MRRAPAETLSLTITHRLSSFSSKEDDLMEYLAVVRRDGDAWTIEFPDCHGCVSVADSEDDVLRNATEALDGWLEAMMQTGRVVPAPKGRKRAPSGAKIVSVRVRAPLAVAISLRWARAKRGYTQAEVARRAGVSQAQIAKLETSSENPTVATLSKVAQALGARLEAQVVLNRS